MIVPSNTYIASILAITANNLTPVLVEPDLATYNIDPLKIEDAITAKTKVILPVHLYGQLAAMPDIMHIAKKHNLLVLLFAHRQQLAVYRSNLRNNRKICSQNAVFTLYS